MRYCTGLSCNHWGVIPTQWKELKQALICPIDKGYLGPIGKVSPVLEAGYKESDEVIPELRNEKTP